MLSRVISSLLLSCRASSMTCWLSRTSMPTFCNANIMGGSMTSTPSGVSATPSACRMDLISSAARLKRPASECTAPRRPSSPALQWSWCSQGACSRWCLAAEPKSQTYGSPLPVSSE